MSSPPKFTMRIAKKKLLSGEEAGIMTIVVHRAYAHLERELRRAFKGQKDIKVILDKRYGDRRRGTQAAAIERRKADRRRQTDELIEVILST